MEKGVFENLAPRKVIFFFFHQTRKWAREAIRVIIHLMKTHRASWNHGRWRELAPYVFYVVKHMCSRYRPSIPF